MQKGRRFPLVQGRDSLLAAQKDDFGHRQCVVPLDHELLGEIVRRGQDVPVMKWTERHVQVTLAHWFFDWRRQLIIPNISHGFFAGRRGECDLLMVSKARYLTEIEIKVNPHDLIGEVRKFKHENRTLDSPFGPLIKRYYIAAPEEVWRKANGAELPLGAGKIAVYIDHESTPRGRLTQPSAYNKAARCLTDKEMIELLRLAYFRLWSSRDTEIFESHQ